MRRTILLVAGAAVVVAVAACAVSAYLASGQSGQSLGEIVFTRHVAKPDRNDLYVVAADRSYLRLLVRNAAEAAVSPDAQRIAFVRGGGIWIMQRDGTRQRRLILRKKLPAVTTVIDSDPAWSPTGRTLYFIGQDRYREGVMFSIFSIRDDGTHLVRLSREGGGRYGGSLGDPSPSPDGRVIAYAYLVDGFHYRDGHIAAGSPTGQPTTLPFTFPGGTDNVSAQPTWSPDGRQMAYSFADVEAWDAPPVSGRPDMSGLYVSRSDGSRPRRIGDGFSPAWLPNGRWIAFARGGIWLVRSDSTGLRQLTRTAANDGDPAWVPRAS